MLNISKRVQKSPKSIVFRVTLQLVSIEDDNDPFWSFKNQPKDDKAICPFKDKDHFKCVVEEKHPTLLQHLFQILRTGVLSNPLDKHAIATWGY